MNANAWALNAKNKLTIWVKFIFKFLLIGYSFNIKHVESYYHMHFGSLLAKSLFRAYYRTVKIISINLSAIVIKQHIEINYADLYIKA